MSIAYVVVTALTATINAAIVIADLAKAEFVLANSAEVGLSPSILPRLAALKAAGAIGLLAGLLGFRLIGLAAATGLVLFFAVALVAHFRARVFHNIAFPGLYFAFAVGSLVLAAQSLP